MLFDKLQVSKRFGSACKTYDEVAYIQQQAARILVEILVKHNPTFIPKAVLDVGAGTGYTTEILHKNFNAPILYTLNDISSEMLECAKLKLDKVCSEKLELQLGDMEELEFEPHNLVISNFALQWANCFSSMVKKLYKRADVFAFSCLLDGTFLEWYKLYDSNSIGNYPTENEVLRIMEEQGAKKMRYVVKEFEISFESLVAFLRYLKRMGASYNMQGMCVHTLKQLVKKNNSTFTTKYKIFFGVLVK